MHSSRVTDGTKISWKRTNRGRFTFQELAKIGAMNRTNSIVSAVFVYQICVGCGDTSIYITNMDNGKIERVLDGHTDYIHALQASDNRLFSASQDGTVRFWDNDACRWSRSKMKKMPERNLENDWARFQCRMTGWFVSVVADQNRVCGIYDGWSALRNFRSIRWFAIPDLRRRFCTLRAIIMN